MENKLKLRRNYITALIALMVALIAMVTATFAWYVYNTSAHTTKVHMAAGTSVQLEISKTYAGPFSTTASLDSFTGRLNPVSSDYIVSSGAVSRVRTTTSGAITENVTPGAVLFQHVDEFQEVSSNNFIAKLFGASTVSDYYTTTLWLRCRGNSDCDLYISGMDYQDSETTFKISTAIRVGFVVHKPGASGAYASQYVFAINPTDVSPERKYNNNKGSEGDVLDCTKTDGSTVRFTPLTPDAYANYNDNTGEVSLKTASQKLCTLGKSDDPVKIDVYIWLEGCDPDCTGAMSEKTLKNLSISFAGYK